jgi:2',3'-cyclic-nucleotide 2'-phosphodiesterase (5'-nucleotidase family)
MGCDAFSPGQKDFAGGKDFLLKLERKSKFPFVSSNIAYNNNKLMFDPYIIKNVEGNKVGIIGLTAKFESDDFIVLDPISSLKSIFDEVYNKSDLIILLLHADTKDEPTLTEIYNSNLPIDMILRSGARTRSSDGGSKIPTYIAGDRGKLLYRIDLNLVDKDMSFVDIPWCNNTIDRMQERLEKMHKGDINIDLMELYKNDPTTLSRIKNYQIQLEKANQLLENSINTISLSKIELGKTIFDRPDILKIVDEGKLKIKDLIGPELPPSLDDKGRMQGDPHYNHGH